VESTAAAGHVVAEADQHAGAHQVENAEAAQVDYDLIAPSAPEPVDVGVEGRDGLRAEAAGEAEDAPVLMLFGPDCEGPP
jgi:hypothetical protein